MTDRKGRTFVLIIFTELVFLVRLIGPAMAQERTPFPEYTGDRVYTVDVPGSYQSLKDTIKELELRIAPVLFCGGSQEAGFRLGGEVCRGAFQRVEPAGQGEGSEA